MTAERTRPDRVVVFRRINGDWGWRLVAPNGLRIATAGEGYRRRSQAMRIAQRVTGLTPELADD